MQTKPMPTTTKSIPKKTNQEIDVLLADPKFFKIPEIRPVHYHLFDVVLRIINEKWSSELDDSNSIDFHKMAAKIKAVVCFLKIYNFIKSRYFSDTSINN